MKERFDFGRSQGKGSPFPRVYNCLRTVITWKGLIRAKQPSCKEGE